MNLERLTDQIKSDEGCRLISYKDTVGVLTIGYGHTGKDVHPGDVWGQDMANQVLDADIENACGLLDKYIPWWRDLDDVRQNVLANMCFNLGIGSLLKFHNTLDFIKNGDYEKAADGMAASLWAKQVGKRAQRLENMMRTGKF